jgi:hypothetical protein
MAAIVHRGGLDVGSVVALRWKSLPHCFFPCGHPPSITSTRAWVSPFDGADRLQVLATV